MGTFAAALVTGVAGFAFGIVAAAVWLHFLPPAQTTALIVAYGLIVQGLSVWKLRRSIRPVRLLPFLAWRSNWRADWRRAAPLDRSGDFAHFDRRRAGPVQSLQPDAAAALADDRRQCGGWCDRRAQRRHRGLDRSCRHCRLRSGAPYGAGRATSNAPRSSRLGSAVFLMTGLWLGGTGMVGADTLQLFAIGLPLLLARHMGRAAALYPAWMKPGFVKSSWACF